MLVPDQFEMYKSRYRTLRIAFSEFWIWPEKFRLVNLPARRLQESAPIILLKRWMREGNRPSGCGCEWNTPGD
jgi:hypothetical protein